MMHYSHSTDGELFHGEFATPEEAAVDAFGNHPSLESIEVGENHMRPAAYYVSGCSILESVSDTAFDDCGEAADGWLETLMRDDEKVVELEKLIGDWIDRNDPVAFWHIKNVRTITRAEMVSGGHMEEEA